jgi:hypothetical protein
MIRRGELRREQAQPVRDRVLSAPVRRREPDGLAHIGVDNAATIKRVSGRIDISLGEREQIRMDFYRAHREQAGFSSVAVRGDPGRRDA